MPSEMGSDRMSEEQRRTRRAVFGVDAQRYDRVRPRYPEALFDAVARYGALHAGAHALEIGAGTGQATRALVARGWIVTAVELAPEMAAVLRQRVPDATVELGAFEDLPAPVPPVDLVIAATSFHWLDPRVRLRRIADALRPGGTVAVVWTRHVRGGTQPFFDAAQACYARWGGNDPAMRLLDEDDVEPRTAELAESPLFTDVRSHRFIQEVAYGTADYRDLLQTYSETIALPDDLRTGLLRCIGTLLENDFGGRIVKRTLHDLVLARRR